MEDEKNEKRSKVERSSGKVRIKHLMQGGHYEVAGKCHFSEAKGQEQEVSRDLADYLLTQEYPTFSSTGSRTQRKRFEEVRPASPAQS